MTKPDTRYADIGNVEVEHGVGAATDKAFVTMRIQDPDRDPVALGHFTPANARDIAAHLMEAAARAEYEQDLVHSMQAAGFEGAIQAGVLAMVRNGEIARHTGEAPGG